jgi:hypothetical protein
MIKNLDVILMHGSTRPQFFAKTLTGNRWKYDTQFSDKIIIPKQHEKDSHQEGQSYARSSINGYLLSEVHNVKWNPARVLRKMSYLTCSPYTHLSTTE